MGFRDPCKEIRELPKDFRLTLPIAKQKAGPGAAVKALIKNAITTLINWRKK